jgi:hypothetical protein
VPKLEPNSYWLQECANGFAYVFCKRRGINRCGNSFSSEQPSPSGCASNVLLLRQEGKRPQEVVGMLWTIFVILLVLWLLGLVSSYTLGGFIHILLVLAVVVLILQLVSGRRAAL